MKIWGKTDSTDEQIKKSKIKDSTDELSKRKMNYTDEQIEN